MHYHRQAHEPFPYVFGVFFLFHKAACALCLGLKTKKVKVFSFKLLLSHVWGQTVFSVAFYSRWGLLGLRIFVGYGQFLTSLCTTCGQYAASISGRHSQAKTMLILSLSVGGLECSFHLIYLLLL